jgi:hypothetical protein
MKMSFETINLPISELILWDENSRFPDQYYNSEESELISYFLTQSDFKIKELIEAIIQDFDLPQIEKLIVWKVDGKNIVVEGNRRLIAYKLLNNPELSEDKLLKKFIIEQQSNIHISDNFNIECLISVEKEQYYRFIERKHVKGNNQVNWQEPERINFLKRRGIESQNDNIKFALTNFVKNLDLPEDTINQILGKGYVTTFFRLVATGPSKDIFGLSTDKNGNLLFNDDNFSDKLKVIIHNVLNKQDFKGNKVDSRELNRNPEIKEYLELIKHEDASKVMKEINQNTSNDLFGNQISQITKVNPSKNIIFTTPRKTPITKRNETLFGKSLILKAGKVNDLYHAILNIYENNQNDNNVLTIIGMSLRLISEVAARVYFDINDKEIAKKDQIYNEFLKIAKKDMRLEQESKNYLSLTSDWLDGSNNLEGMLAKYSHGNITVTKDGILKNSFIIGEILEQYFKK